MTPHADLLRRLLPPDSYDPQALNLGVELEAEGNALDDVVDVAAQVEAEILPSTTVQMLAEWERVFGLPDPCTLLGTTFGERRAAVVAKVTDRGGQTIDYFVRLAAKYGHAITITEFQPFTCESTVEEEVFDESRAYTFRVNSVLVGDVVEATCEDGCETPLRTWGTHQLECLINRLKPAHTLALYGYF